MRVRVVLITLAVALLGFAPAPFQKAERRRADPNDLGGVWALVASEVHGTSEGPDQTNYLAEITKEQFAFVHKTTRGTAVYALRLYPELAPPAFTWSWRAKNSVTFVGSYRLRGDELTIVFSGGSRIEERPTDFEGKREFRYVFRRLHR